MTNQIIIPPVEGWQESTLYLVEAAFSPTNPISVYYFYSGFLNGENKSPGGYNQILLTEDFLEISNVYYLKVIKKLHSDKDYKSPHQYKLVSELV